MREFYLNSLGGGLRISLCGGFVAAHRGFCRYRYYITLTNQPFCLESQHGR